MHHNTEYQSPHIMLRIAAFCTSWLYLWYYSPAPSFLQIACGLWMADLFTGLVHMYLDTFTAFHVPVIGPIAASFQEHHKSPTDIISKPTLKLLAQTSAFFPLPVLWCLLLPVGTHGCGTVFCATSWLSQIAHQYAHVPASDVPYFMAVLQRYGLVLNRCTHSPHHTGTFDRNYGMVNGWSNPALNTICTIYTVLCGARGMRGGMRGEDAYYDDQMALNPLYRPYQHAFFTYEGSTDAFVDAKYATILQWLQEFLRVHGYLHDVQELATWRAPLPEIQHIGACRQGLTIHLLVNHRNVGGKRLLHVLQYGVGGPTAIIPKLSRASDFTLAQHAWSMAQFMWAMGRYILFASPRLVVSDQCMMFRESFPRVPPVDQVAHILCKISKALRRPTLTCWTPVVFEDTTAVQNDVGIMLFEYREGMTRAELYVRLRSARSMCIGARYLGRFGTSQASMYAKRRVDVVLTMVMATGDSCTSLEGLTTYCGAFHPLTYINNSYPCYAYAATLGATTHVTYSICDKDFVTENRSLEGCCRTVVA